MERLPNEIWLEIVYSFHNLNKRYQQLITPFINNIDLSNISYKLFKQFFEHIFPQYANQIYSFTLKNCFQLNLFNDFCQRQIPTPQGHRSSAHTEKKQPQRVLSNRIKSVFQLPKNLQRLTLTDDRNPRTTDETCYYEYHDPSDIDFYFERLTPQFCEHLTDLRILANFSLSQTIEQIASNVQLSKTLTHLTLIPSNSDVSLWHSWDEKSKLHENRITKMLMPNMKLLTIHLFHYEDVFFLFLLMINLNELNLSIAIMDNEFTKHDWKNEIKILRIPKQFNKLHLESIILDENNSDIRFKPKFQEIKMFLMLFKDQLESLTLIVFNSSDKEFTNPNQLQDDFPYLKSFQYLIHTNQSPIGYNQYVKKLPNNTYEIYNSGCRPISFIINDRRRLQCEEYPPALLYNNVTLLNIFEDKTLNDIQLTFKLYHLVELRYDTYYGFSESNTITFKVLQTVLRLSPNLKIFHLSAETSQRLIDLLKLLPISSLKNLTNLLFRTEKSTFHPTFLIELAQIIAPYNRLKYLSLSKIYPTIKNNRTSHFLTSSTIIDHVKKYFPGIIHLDLSMYANDLKQEQAYNGFKIWLYQHENDLMTLINSQNEKKFNLWL